MRALTVLVGLFCGSVLAAPASATLPNPLAQMPLPKQALGPDAASLPLAADSGPDSNAKAARNAGNGVTAADLAKQGRITGYRLDYSDAAPTADPRRGPLVAVETIAEVYRSPATAATGLAFWRGVTKRLQGTRSGVTVAMRPFGARVEDGTFAFELSYSLAGRTVSYVGDVVFRTGSYLGAVFVTATDRTGLRSRTVALARKLAARIHRVLAGDVR
jgi:hypothetical protein